MFPKNTKNSQMNIRQFPGCHPDNNDCHAKHVKYVWHQYVFDPLHFIAGRNLLNKKDVPPSTIKESSESSQTIDESDGLGTSAMDKGDPFEDCS